MKGDCCLNVLLLKLLERLNYEMINELNVWIYNCLKTVEVWRLECSTLLWGIYKTKQKLLSGVHQIYVYISRDYVRAEKNGTHLVFLTITNVLLPNIIEKWELKRKERTKKHSYKTLSKYRKICSCNVHKLPKVSVHTEWTWTGEELDEIVFFGTLYKPQHQTHNRWIVSLFPPFWDHVCLPSVHHQTRPNSIYGQKIARRMT